MNPTILSALVLATLCFCSAMGVVFTTHLTREAHAEISRTRYIVDELDIQWSQLQIELNTFAEHSLIESQARRRLNMVFPSLEGTVMVVR
jgi:cell division protein FtsL